MRVAERAGFALGDLQVDGAGAMTVVLRMAGKPPKQAAEAMGDA
jgi:hypothetical protein